MAKLPTIKKILPEQFPDLKWMPEFSQHINRFMEEVSRALNNQLTFSENMSAVIKTVQLDGIFPVKFSWTLPSKPVAAWIGQCREVTGEHTVIMTALYLDWEFNNDGMFQINGVAGLTPIPTNKFNITIVAITG